MPTQLATSGAVQHDTAAGGSYTARGNATSISKWVSGSSWLTAHAVYDDAGNRTAVVDPAGYPTVYSFNDDSDAWYYSNCAPSSGNAAAYISSVTNGNACK
jgi:hypothetical protein